jgi:hypothetical protein
MMKNINKIKALLVVAIACWGCSPSNAQENPASTGLKTDEKISQFLRVYYPESGLTEGEVLNAVYMYNATLTEENNKLLSASLRLIVQKKSLPKGAWIRHWADKKRTHEMWFLELNRDRQPADVAPEPGSVDLIIKIPIRVIHSKKLMVE